MCLPPCNPLSLTHQEPLAVVKIRRIKWTQDQDTELCRLVKATEGSGSALWEAASKAVGHTAVACQARYGTLRRGELRFLSLHLHFPFLTIVLAPSCGRLRRIDLDAPR